MARTKTRVDIEKALNGERDRLAKIFSLLKNPEFAWRKSETIGYQNECLRKISELEHELEACINAEQCKEQERINREPDKTDIYESFLEVLGHTTDNVVTEELGQLVNEIKSLEKDIEIQKQECDKLYDEIKKQKDEYNKQEDEYNKILKDFRRAL